MLIMLRRCGLVGLLLLLMAVSIIHMSAIRRSNRRCIRPVMRWWWWLLAICRLRIPSAEVHRVAPDLVTIYLILLNLLVGHRNRVLTRLIWRWTIPILLRAGRWCQVG